MIENIFTTKISVKDNLIEIKVHSLSKEQNQTREVFSKKWNERETSQGKDKSFARQKDWYLKLYGFDTESEMSNFLKNKKYIFDAGCGLGYKAAWFSQLSPQSIVLAMDISDSVYIAAKKYGHIKNLFFIKGDIAKTQLKDDVIDYVSCDQVLHHTDNPEDTFQELVRVLSVGGEFSCYVYRKKAIPRELLDDYFRQKSMHLSHEELMELSKQVTELGKRLNELRIEFDSPDIPLLDIKGGKYDLQRFIYWNFLKCFWNDELGYETSVLTNYDWYAPSKAKRYTKDEFLKMVIKNNLTVKFFHEEEACYSGRFKK